MENYIDLRNSNDYEKLKEPAKILAGGGIVVFPTETVYGIGTNALDEQAVKKLYEVKKRPLSKPISLLVSDIKMIEEVAENITEAEYRIIEKFCPGPITIILKRKKNVPDIVTANGNTVGVRIPDGKIARKLIEYAGVPLATSSANISGEPSSTKLKTIFKDFEGKVDCFINGGKSKLGIASTIVKIEKGVPIILREGIITKKEIENTIKNI